MSRSPIVTAPAANTSMDLTCRRRGPPQQHERTLGTSSKGRPDPQRSFASAAERQLCPTPTFAPARGRSGRQSSEQRHVGLQRLEVAPTVALVSDESDLIWPEFGGAKLPTSRRMPLAIIILAVRLS